MRSDPMSAKTVSERELSTPDLHLELTSVRSEEKRSKEPAK